jgi:glutamate dehydrogenase (NAD(P)+)
MEALKELDIPAENATAVVQGFGNVGSVAALEMYQRGIKIIAISDRYGAIVNHDGLDVPALTKHMYGAPAGLTQRLQDFPGAEEIDAEEMLTLPCTVLAPAALERVVHGGNAGKLRCRILAEGANGPTTPEADAVLANSDIFVIPDVLCNAGGVTVSYFEWVQDIQQLMWSEDQVNHKLRELMLRAYGQVRRLARDRRVPMRTAGLMLGVQKVAQEKIRRGLFP